MSIRLMQKAWETELKGNELLVLLSLSDNASDEGYCWPSWETIMKKTKVSRGTLSSILNKLEDGGYIKRESRKRQNGSDASNGYFIFPTQSSKVEHRGKVQKLNYQSSEVEHLYEPSLEPSNIYTEFKSKFSYINEESFNMLVSHLKAKYKNVTKVRITNNIKKLKDNPSLFIKAVDKMIELNYSGLFVPSEKDFKLNYSEQKELNQDIKVEVYKNGNYKDANGDIRNISGYIV